MSFQKISKENGKLFIRIEKNKIHSPIKSKSIIIAVAAILITLSLMMSVSAVRECVIEYIINSYEEFAEIFYSEEINETIEYIYSFEEIPEGFHESSRRHENDLFEIEYDNSKNEKNTFSTKCK